SFLALLFLQPLPSPPCALLTYLTLLPLQAFLPFLSLHSLTTILSPLKFRFASSALRSSVKVQSILIEHRICSLSKKTF
ncbi:hypothetical protein CABS01_10917, partial [Colletotrichum abscissum]|uniref:uncharacterized protein n=1 Tax=Colletotrichum abscissum TaxID=1671311 RepID=UPI0027D51A63